MKKKILFLVVMTILLSSGNIWAQTNGSWVVPFLNNLIPEADRLEFGQNIQSNYLQTLTENNYSFSAGAYDQDGTLLFYLVDEKVYDANSNYIDDIYSLNPVENIFNPEIEIVRRPDNAQSIITFFIIWSSHAPVNGENDGGFFYNEVTYNKSNGQINVGDYQELPYYPGPGLGYSYSAFAVSKVDNGKKYLYRCTRNGITKCEITATGFSSNVSLVLSSDDPGIGNLENFRAYNFEMKKDANGNTVFAWNTKYPYGGADKDKIFVYNVEDDVSKIIDINTNNTGIINGLEFSTYNDEIIYVSYDSDGTSSGLYEVNYINESTNLISSNNEYSNTFLQIAPDGNIYGVSNDGADFCKIDMNTGVFQPNAFSNGNVITYRGNNNYILPENEQLPLSLTTSQMNIACEGNTDGWAMAGVFGGIPPYTYEWTDQTGDVISTSPVADNLGAGTYVCCITDSDVPPVTVCQNVTIIVDNSLLNYTQHDMVDIYSSTPDWNNNNYDKFEVGIFVHTGADFTISNSYLEFGKNAKIIVEQGATLTLSNTTLTYLSECPMLWQGIEVWGDASKSQYEDNGVQYQGKIIMLNGSMIEGAKIGVLLAARYGTGYDLSKTGGIIQISDDGIEQTRSAFFNNNTNSIYFLDYQNTHFNNEVDNLSFIKDCSFISDDNYLGNSSWGNTHLRMQFVRGIKIAGCSFENNTSQPHNGNGIYSYSSGFKVYSVCSNQTSPCSGYLNICKFKNLQYGIKAASFNTPDAVRVEDAEFTNNSYGIMLNTVNYATIIFNDFYIGENPIDQSECEGEGETVSAYGIDMDNCHGFAIEENHFYKYEGAPKGNYTGIRCKDSNTEYDLIYKNTFDGLSYGNFAEGVNRNNPNIDEDGLEFQCNINNGNNVDFIVTGGKYPQIRTFQGTKDMEAGNTFSNGAQPPDGNFENDGEQVIDYFYLTNPPTYYTDGKVVLIDDAGENTCPSHYGGGGSGGTDDRGVVLTPEQKQQTEQEFAANLNDYNNVKALFDNLKDGGNTDATINDVETACPDDMWELRAELLGKSPHLSKEVLMTAADKTDVLPESVLFEILSANPDELRKEELISYLENKEQPLPDYMISILRQLAGGITYKTILLNDMAKYNAAKTRAAYDLIRSCLNDTVTDFQYLRNWLDNLHSLNADMQIVTSYIQEGDYSSAQSLLDILPEIYNLEGNELENFNNYKLLVEKQMEWKQQGRTVFQLDSTEIALLNDFAYNGTGKAANMAKSILEYAYGYHFCNCLPVSDTAGMKSADVKEPISSIIGNGIEIEATPNPASKWVAFNYKLPVFADEAILKISDVKGSIITTFKLNAKQGQQVWDIRNVKEGVYFYTLNVRNLSKSGKLIVK